MPPNRATSGCLPSRSIARLEAGSQPVRCLDLGLVFGRHLRHRRAVLACQGLEHGGLHDPAQPMQPVDVPGEQVVLDDAPVDGPEGGDDRVVVPVGQGLLLGGLAAVQVRGALGLDHLEGHAQRDLPVDRATAPGGLAAVVLDGDLVAEESCRAGAGVGDQRLVLGQFQLEFVTQELRQPLFDLLGFGLRPGEPEQMVIGLCRGPGYADPAGGCPGQRAVRGCWIGITRRGCS